MSAAKSPWSMAAFYAVGQEDCIIMCLLYCMCTTVTQNTDVPGGDFCPLCGDDEVPPNLPTHQRSDSSGEHCQSLLLTL